MGYVRNVDERPEDVAFSGGIQEVVTHSNASISSHHARPDIHTRIVLLFYCRRMQKALSVTCSSFLSPCQSQVFGRERTFWGSNVNSRTIS